MKRPSDSVTSLVCTGLCSQMSWSYEDFIACCLVERLWQLEQHKPHMLAHFLPQGCTAAALLQQLPESVQQVLQAKLQTQLSLTSTCSLQSPLECVLSLDRQISEALAASLEGLLELELRAASSPALARPTAAAA